MVRRALLSVSDKTGVADLARALRRWDCEIVSTGGTGQALRDAGIPVVDIATVTGNPEAFGGRMKTISFAIESAILFDRDRDRAEAERLGIAPIDLVVCNLYPFGKHRDAGAELDALIEQIDIGGPTMIRAAAKNYRYVAAVCDPEDYGDLIGELDARQGALSLETRARLMRKAFNHTADYDAMIAQALDERFGETSLRLAFGGGRKLRYGENAHQGAVVLRERAAAASLYDLEVLGGKELSYNNLVDIHAAASAVRDLAVPACAVVKHTNPCGLCHAASARVALETAWRSDPVSAFGSVIAFNGRVDRAAVEFLRLEAADRAERKFVEVVVAPAFEDAAVLYLRQNENLRIVRLDIQGLRRLKEVKLLGGAALVQDADSVLLAKLEVVSAVRPEGDLEPGGALRRLIEFGLVAARQVKSNAIVIVAEIGGALRLLGMGAGQPNRVVSTRLAVERARATLAGEGLDETAIREVLGRAVLVSDAFFPFPDSVEFAADAGVRTFVEPGGSIRDREVMACVDDRGASMIFTGVRHFQH
ncbi:MAG: bifunctional phosphoribosylaminoimidazolecarboxamide formyltransferase/IMP cyclohydrolase [Candidatus Bipolaricaulis sp.]|nr:bifunctional phosphoribosylaminoimidazolecarboxamide formyltransferase/IMP cyclohydrolase [Candidatus Bipolaricaulis sp.]